MASENRDWPGYYIQYKQGKRISGDGPWETANDALHYFDAEVGIPARIVRFVPQTGALLPQTEWLAPKLGKPV